MPLDSIEAIYLVSNTVVPVYREQIELAQTALGTTFPSGYDEFMLRFGVGDFSGFLRPYEPDRVVAELATNRGMLNPDFWDQDDVLFSSEEWANLIPFADTIDSDVFSFLPPKPEQIFVLPRQDNRIWVAGRTFLDLLNWVTRSGKLVQPFEATFFQPWNDYARIRLNNSTRVFKIEEMNAIFKSVGAADYFQLGTNGKSIDYFIQKYGAHFKYLLLDNYDQFIVSFDRDSAAEFLPAIKHVLAGKGFRITEHSHIAALPDLS